MAGLRNVGAPVTSNPDVVYQDYTRLIKNQELTIEEIDTAINAGLGSYATKTYVDQQDALLATTAYVNAQDDLRVKLSRREQANGVAGLDATGQISPNRINVGQTQRFFRGPWSPSSYMGAVPTITTEQTLYTCPVTDPGYPYKLIVFGEVDAHTNADTEHAIVTVRIANETTGEVIATGRGAQDAQESLFSGDNFNRSNNLSSLGSPDWEQDYIGAEGKLGIWSNATGWADSGYGVTTATALRVKPTDMITGSNFQRIYAVMGGLYPGGQNRNNGEDDYACIRWYMRVNDAKTQYVAWEATEKDVRLVYANGGLEAQLGTKVSMSKFVDGTTVTCLAGDLTGGSRKFYFYRNSTLVHSVDDVSAVTAMGPNNRRWGFGVRTGTEFGLFGQINPPDMDSIAISDYVPNYQPVIITPTALDTATVRTGPTTLYVRARRSGAAAISSVSPHKPSLHVMAVPA